MADSERNILHTLSVTKPNSSIPKPGLLLPFNSSIGVTYLMSISPNHISLARIGWLEYLLQISDDAFCDLEIHCKTNVGFHRNIDLSTLYLTSHHLFLREKDGVVVLPTIVTIKVCEPVADCWAIGLATIAGTESRGYPGALIGSASCISKVYSAISRPTRAWAWAIALVLLG